MEAYLSWIGSKEQTRRLLGKARAIWNGYLTHPFVRGLGNGTLDKEKFRFYMKQDYLYLIDYTRVFAVGVAKAHDEDLMRFFSNCIHQILNVEMDIHKAYMRRLDISSKEVGATSASLDNQSYTAYMLRVAYEAGAVEILAAILSCALSYEYIAKDILSKNPNADKHPFYGEWVAGYANEDFQKNNQSIVSHFEALAKDISEKQFRCCERIFETCSRYEMMFWNMAWETKPLY
jgi:thiaminase/transcriptional activator TenA